MWKNVCEVEKFLNWVWCDQLMHSIIAQLDKKDVLFFYKKWIPIDEVWSLCMFNYHFVRCLFPWSYEDYIAEYERLKEICIEKEISLKRFGMPDTVEEFSDTIYAYFFWKKEKNTRKAISWYIYLIKDDKWFIKIGRSRSPRDRLKKYVTENSGEIILIKIFNVTDDVLAEKELLNYFKDKKHRSEWFKLNSEDIESIYLLESFTSLIIDEKKN